MATKQRNISASDIFTTEKERKDLEAYISFHVQEFGPTGINRAIGDFCASRIEIMQRIKDHGLLFSYFCYLMEGLITRAIRPTNPSEPKNQESKNPAPKPDEPKS